MTDQESVLVLLDTLSTQALRELVASCEVDVDDHRVRLQLMEALARFYTSPADLLGDLDRATLHDLCEAFELPANGSTVQLRDRLLRCLAEMTLDEDDGEPVVPPHGATVPFIPRQAPVPSGPWGSRLPDESSGRSPEASASYLAEEPVANDPPAALGGWWTVLGAGAVVMGVGRFVNELEYLYPKRGNVIASGRRRNNPLAIAIKGVATLGGIAFILLMILGSILGGIANSVHLSPVTPHSSLGPIQPLPQPGRM